MTERVDRLLEQLSSESRDLNSSIERTRTPNHAPEIPWLSSIRAEELDVLLFGMLTLLRDEAADVSRCNALLRQLTAPRQSRTFEAPTLSEQSVETVAQMYREGNAWGLRTHALLTLLILRGNAVGWNRFADLIVESPPLEPEAAAEAFAPLWRRADGPYDQLFPGLFQALGHLSVAAIVLDLANFLTRSGRLKKHPGKDRAEELIGLLGQLVERLESLEETSRERGVSDLSEARRVTETISLAISLCDALALIQDPAAIGKLYRMLELAHRRLRVEAAAALASFQDETGVRTLIEMASEPLVRLRACAYAKELGREDEIDPQYRTPVAQAESELVLRLSERDFFGMPPNACELIDQRSLVWPGASEAVDCFLFRFRYQTSMGAYENIGIAGPLAYALPADLTSLEPESIYAILAGWHTEHDDLRMMKLDPANSRERTLVQQHVRQLESQGVHAIEPQFVGHFFEHRIFVFSAVRDDDEGGTVLAAPEGLFWLAARSEVRPVDPQTAYHAYVGYQVLSHFNPGFGPSDPSGWFRRL